MPESESGRNRKIISSEQFFKKIGVPVRLRTHRYGTLKMRGPTIRDIEFLSDFFEQNSTPKETAIQIIRHQLISPAISVEEIRTWDDRLLQRVATAWVRDMRGLAIEVPAQKLSFEEFNRTVRDYASEQHRKGREIAAQFARTIPKVSIPQVNLPTFPAIVPTLFPSELALAKLYSTPMYDRIQRDIQTLANTTFRLEEQIRALAVSSVAQLDIGKLMPTFPDFTELIERLEELRQTDEAFKESGFAFLVDLMDRGVKTRLAQVNPKVRRAVITKRIVIYTCSDIFEKRLRTSIESTPLLRRRWPIISQALYAHRDRAYWTSVPTLLTQLEGVITDAMILKGEAEKRGGKFYPKGKNFEFTGLRGKFNASSIKVNANLQSVADLIANHLLGERNDILHGTHISYGKAKLSTQILLVLLILAEEISSFTDS